MLFTYSGRGQKLVSWKPNQKVGVVRKLGRPITNDNIENVDDFTSKFGTPRPQKHYRKQLVPYFQTKSSRKVSSDDVNVSHTLDEHYCSKIDSNSNILHSYVLDKPEPCLGTKIGNKCVGGNTNVRYRSANTNLNKNYHQSTSSYLRSKCKTYKQNSTLGNRDESDENQYTMTSCADSNCNKTIFKPNNKHFTKQGSVSSSTRLLRLKQNTINQNGASFLSAYGRGAANAGKYKNAINGETVFFDKSKDNKQLCNNLPMNFRKSSSRNQSKIDC